MYLPGLYHPLEKSVVYFVAPRPGLPEEDQVRRVAVPCALPQLFRPWRAGLEPVELEGGLGTIDPLHEEGELAPGAYELDDESFVGPGFLG